MDPSQGVALHVEVPVLEMLSEVMEQGKEEVPVSSFGFLAVMTVSLAGWYPITTKVSTPTSQPSLLLIT
jgi:hypothetical protein